MDAAVVDTALSTALPTLAPGRRAILVSLKTRGEARAEEVAEDLGVTASAVRQHLTALMRDDLVGRRETRGGPGRPKHHYHLTPRADGLFPRAYPQLTNELLAYLEEEDPAVVTHLFLRRRDRRIREARARLGDGDLASRVAGLTRILDEDGYLADCSEEADGSFRIVEHNCAVLGIALRHGQACSSEIDFIRSVLPDASVERVTHIASGQRQCAYVVRPAGGSTDPAGRPGGTAGPGGRPGGTAGSGGRPKTSAGPRGRSKTTAEPGGPPCSATW
ncbi:MAG: helix-turn-helix transcriptional regulator [Acidimicrobiales bacterium]